MSQVFEAESEATRLRALYITMVKRSVGDFLYDFDGKFTRQNQTGFVKVDYQTGERREITDYAELKQNGLIASNVAHTLIGMERLNQLQSAVETVLKENIPGDFIETGVLRGGACVFMRALLKAYGDTQRIVWVADSFQGFPDLQTGRRESIAPIEVDAWAASLEAVQQVFSNYELLDEQVRFLSGWFCDSLPEAPVDILSILRLDGDLYISTRDALQYLYPKVAVGGYVIIDDYYAFDECRAAVRAYRKSHGIKTALVRVDPVCVYWRKES